MVGPLTSRVAVALGLAALAAAGCAPGAGPAPTGTYRGTAILPGDTLEMSVELRAIPIQTPEGNEAESLAATMSAPALQVLDRPLADVRWEPPHLYFVASKDEMPLIFEATLRGTSLRGTIRFRGLPRAWGAPPRASFALAPDRAAAAPPYTTEAVDIPGDSVTLSGTRFVPAGAGPFPAAVLLAGSSEPLRDGLRPYADGFARAGIVALTFDRRGTGGSTGDSASATYADLAEDGAAAVRFLASRPDVDSNRVAVWGLSQGAMLAPRVAQGAPVSTIVAVSAPGVPLGAIAAYQDSVRVRAAGFGDAEAGEAAALDRALQRDLRAANPRDSLESRLAAAQRTRWARVTALPERAPSEEERRGWYWGGRNEDVLAPWRTTRVPVLLVYGGADWNLPAQLSDSLITRALLAARAPKFSSLIYPFANHAIKRMPLPGGPLVWPRVMPGYPDSVSAWIRAAQRPAPEPNAPPRRFHRRRHR
jgi:dienelactone hydrolase